MKAQYIRVASDLHLEQWRDRDIDSLVIDHLPLRANDSRSILILAGDISCFPDQLVAFIKAVEQRFVRVVYLAGNHEWYRHDIQTVIAQTRALFEQYTVNTSHALGTVGVEIIDGVRIIYGTLWADGGHDVLEQFRVRNGLWDFNLIRNGSEFFTVPDMMKMHYDQRDLIEQELAKPEKYRYTVVATHHMPSYLLCAPRFGTDINGGFASASDHLLQKPLAPDLWVHGHTHDRGNRMLHNTKIVANPSGYRSEFGNGYSSEGPVFVRLSDSRVFGI